MKPKRKINLKSFCIATLRRASYRWPAREQCRKNARVTRNQYKCVACPSNVLYKRKETQIDHIEPVISVEKGWQGFDVFIERLFREDPKDYQLMCKNHHKIKTEQEKELRKFHRKLNKEKDEI